MENHVYKLIELTGTSTKSIEDAVNTALARAGKTVKNLRWFEVIETRGDIDRDRVRHWQVTIKVAFTIEDAAILPEHKALEAAEPMPSHGFRVSEVGAPATMATITDAMTLAGNCP
jgi:flavin-binding protein dodecin